MVCGFSNVPTGLRFIVLIREDSVESLITKAALLLSYFKRLIVNLAGVEFTTSRIAARCSTNIVTSLKAIDVVIFSRGWER